MAIKLQTMECKNTEHASFTEIRESILAAAKAAKEAGRHDKLVIELPQGKHTLTEPFRLSAVENPELASVDITLTSSVTGAAEINSLVRMDGKLFAPVKGTDYFVY